MKEWIGDEDAEVETFPRSLVLLVLQAGGSTEQVEPSIFVVREDALTERLMMLGREGIMKGIPSWEKASRIG